MTPWLVVPLVLAALLAGSGLLAGWWLRARLPAPAVPVAGLALLVVVGGLLTVSPRTAPVAVPALAGLALVGLARGLLRATRVDAARAGRVAALGAAAYVAAAGPWLATGQAGPPGYLRLDDTPTWLLTTDHVLERGRDLAGLDPSTPTSVLQTWLGSGYPVGSFLPLGAAGRLTGTDLALAYGPVLAVTAALVALGLAAVARRYVGGRWRAAAAGLVGAQASLLVAYTGWGGVKEVTTAALLPGLAVAAALAVRDPRALALAALLAGALLQVLGPQGAVWAAPGLLAALVAAGVGGVRRLPPGAGPEVARGLARRAAAPLAASAAVLCVALVPVVAAFGFVRFAQPGQVQATDAELGNLAAPVPLLHAAGLWPGGDPLAPAGGGAASTAVAVLCLAAAAVALALAVLARRPELPLLAGVAVVGAVPALLLGSPWVDAKVLAVLSPVVLVAAAALPLGWADSPAPVVRGVAAVLAVVLAGATAASTATAARTATVGPHERLADLDVVGTLVAGRGPTLLLDPDVYASRWSLRRGDVVGASDLRPDVVPRRDGTPVPSLTTVDVGEVAPAALAGYRTLVRRWSPAASRPPQAYALVGRVGDWEVWTRDGDEPVPAGRDLPLGAGGADPTGVPDCAAVLALARGATAVAAVPRTPPVVAAVDPAGAPPPWRSGGAVVPVVDGSLQLRVTVPRAGAWRLWVGGGTTGRLTASVDDRPAGSVTHDLAHGAPWLALDAVELDAGEHVVRLAYDHRAGVGSGLRAPVGPVALTPVEEEGDLPVLSLPAARAGELCDGRAYDWVAAS